VRLVLSPLFPSVGLLLSEARINPVRHRLGLGQGLRLTTPERRGVIFWTFQQQEVVDALVSRGGHVGEPQSVW